MINLNKVSFLIYFFLCLFSSNFILASVEEIVVLGDWKEISPDKNDASIVLLGSKEIDNQAVNHFEELSYLVPNLNFAASDSRARYFQIRGIGEMSGYQGTPNSSVGFLIDDIDENIF